MYLIRILSENPGDHIDIVDQAVVEDTPGHLQILYSRQGRVTRDRLDRVNVTDLAFANSVPYFRIARIKSPIERAEQRFAHFFRYFVALDCVRAIFRYGLLAENRFFRFESLDNDVLVSISWRRHNHRVDTTCESHKTRIICLIAKHLDQ